MKANAFQRLINRKPARNEHCLQRSIVKWCDGLGWPLVQGRFLAIPNGGARDAITGARLKAEGVRPGAPDLVFWRDAAKVLWVEVKNGTSGQISASQKALHAALIANGHRVVVVRDLAGAMQAVTEFYRDKA
jgi:hypothetical protein